MKSLTTVVILGLTLIRVAMVWGSEVVQEKVVTDELKCKTANGITVKVNSAQECFDRGGKLVEKIVIEEQETIKK